MKEYAGVVTPLCISESLLYAGKYCSQIHAPIALPLSKEPAGTHRLGDGEADDLVWRIWRRKKSRALSEDGSSRSRPHCADHLQCTVP